MGLTITNEMINNEIIPVVVVTLDLLNKTLLITDEADLPLTRITGAMASSEITTLLTTEGVTAPKLEEAVTKFTSQTNSSGSAMVPEYFWVLGGAIADIKLKVENAELNSEFDAWNYGLIPEDPALAYELSTIATQKGRMVWSGTSNLEKLEDDQISNRIMRYANVDELMHIAALGYLMNGSNRMSSNFKTLQGINAMDDAYVQLMDVYKENGVNVYVKQYKINTLVGDWTSDGVTAFERIHVYDTLKYNVSNAIAQFWNQTDFFGLEDLGRANLQDIIELALTEAETNGFIVADSWNVIVPEVTVDMLMNRKFDNIEYSFVPRLSTTKVEIKGIEVYEL